MAGWRFAATATSVWRKAVLQSYLYAKADARPAMLKEAYKAAFFVMLVNRYRTSGIYCRSKQELLHRLHGTEKEIITAGLNFAQWLATHSEKAAYAMLLHWCRTEIARNR